MSKQIKTREFRNENGYVGCGQGVSIMVSLLRMNNAGWNMRRWKRALLIDIIKSPTDLLVQCCMYPALDEYNFIACLWRVLCVESG